MIILFIINSVFYILITIFLLTFYYGYKRELEELENRFLQLEKRVPSKEVLDVACKKGKGGKRK